jgi:hypothetical protein
MTNSRVWSYQRIGYLIPILRLFGYDEIVCAVLVA